MVKKMLGMDILYIYIERENKAHNASAENTPEWKGFD